MGKEKGRDLTYNNYADVVGYSDSYYKMLFPEATITLKINFEKVIIENCRFKKVVMLVTIKDPRNKKPVFLVTNLDVSTDLEAMESFGTYLERWGIEEGYRFLK